eukprot:6918113-Ditylum_brightwellii.AAC.1
MWTGPSSAVQQKNVLLHHDKEIICCVAQQDTKHLSPRVPTRRWKFLPTRASFHLTSFLSYWGFHHFPQACLSARVEQKSQVICKPTSHCPVPTTNKKEWKKQTTPPILQGWASSHHKQEGARGREPPPNKMEDAKEKGSKRQRSLPEYSIISKRMGERGKDPSP